MRLVNITFLALMSTGCASTPLNRQSTHALHVCFLTPPDKAGEPVVLPETQGWRLVTRRRIDPKRHSLNPYVGNGCSSKANCFEYWFQKDNGSIRYCVTDDCWAASVGFTASEGEWTASEGNQFVCTS
ncbi:MAG TPA: hypothetical protein VMZ90_12635 [Vicinamibacterales bacterium]|nr:hypothetical protein [Vicinamibacterales bacterium]